MVNVLCAHMNTGIYLGIIYKQGTVYQIKKQQNDYPND